MIHTELKGKRVLFPDFPESTDSGSRMAYSKTGTNPSVCECIIWILNLKSLLSYFVFQPVET